MSKQKLIVILLLFGQAASAQRTREDSTHRTREIDAVKLRGYTPVKKAATQGVRAIVIDTKAAAEQPNTLSEVMNRSAGIRIRQSGGFGTRPDVSINGFTGKAVKYFKDGIPLDYLGDGYNIGNVPMETLSRVEVYKGVLPVELGADALGGAVNLVSKIPGKKNLNAYYESGSFETYRAGAGGSIRSKDDQWLIGAESFLNLSKNNYKALVSVPDPQTANLHALRLPMFHNAYRNYYGEIFAAATNRSWADELRLSIKSFYWDRQQQHPAMMTDAFGRVQAKQYTVAPSFEYRKSFADGRAEIRQFISYNRLRTQRIDTARVTYDWYGNYFPKQTPGESRLPSDSEINERQWLSRTNFSFKPIEEMTVALNYVLSHSTRDGADPYGQKLNGDGVDLLSIQSKYQKHVLGLGITNHFLGRKLQNDLVGKYYFFSGEGLDNLWRAATVTSAETTKQKKGYFGVADAVKYKIGGGHLVRFSAEYAYRLPEREELFGNNIFIVSNFALKPEHSLNLNAGYRWDYGDRFFIDANAFYRRTKDLILLVPIQAPNAQYQNVENVHGYGFDLDANFKINKNYSISGNATWQNLRLFNYQEAINQWKNGTRLRNTPYFFANASMAASYGSVLAEGDVLKIYLHYNFLREFYLESIRRELEPGGFLGLSGSARVNTQLLIPNQHVLNFGTVYQLPGRHYNVGMELRNIFNQDIYDYYRVQRAGRNGSIKLSYNF